MRILDRYICREVFSHAVLGLAVFTFVFFVPQLVRLMELLVRHSASPGNVVLLFLCTFPGVLSFTLPIAVLVGVLIGLGRLSADSELIALNAVGIGLRRILVPVGVLALGTGLLTMAMTLWLGPAALRTFRTLEDRLRTSQASFQVQPRVFDERFPRLVLYVEDVEAAATRWRGVFLAESGAESGSRLTLAEEAIVIADREQGKLQFHLRGGSTHEYSRRDPNRYSVTTFGESDWPVEVSDSAALRQREPTIPERSLGDLLAQRGGRWREARVEVHRRLAFPVACLVFALLAVPLGTRPRRGGRAAGFLITLLLVCGYYLLFIVGAGMARQGTLSPWLGIWAANLLTGLLGLALLPRMEQTRGEGWLARAIHALANWRRRRPRKPAPTPTAPVSMQNGPVERRRPASPARVGRTGFPLLMDLYVLRNFFFYFLLLLAGFILLFEAFTFFELLDDIARHRSPFLMVLNYFRYLAAYLVYQLAPLAALVATLVTLGAMTKNNEIVAFKAGGVSLYRLALPLLVAGLTLAGAMLVLDDTYLPYANKRQDALRNQIKGRPAQTFFQPRRQWIFGENSKVYNYELFDPDRKLFGGLNVFELDPATFRLRRRVFAARAHWADQQQTWILESGWVRDFDGATITQYAPFLVTALTELHEPPGYFNREVRQYYQMNWRELQQYIHDLHQAGFDVARLSVQWHKKLAFPLIAPIIILLAIPFAFLVGTRGAVGGLALGVAIAIVYWATSELFVAMGAVGQLPALLA
ncbi:MAG: LPS export ABC transporter permease LptF, partial [Acidobacteria bacterium]|nr:LPS export ABC transporter permease LptF [Acidobacteriota bacterium]